MGIRPEDILILPEGNTSERVRTVRERLDVVVELTRFEGHLTIRVTEVFSESIIGTAWATTTRASHV